MARTPTPLDQSVPEKGSDQSEGLRLPKQLKSQFLLEAATERQNRVYPYKTKKKAVNTRSLKKSRIALAHAIKLGDRKHAWHMYATEIREILSSQRVTGVEVVDAILGAAKDLWQNQWILGALMSPAELLTETLKQPSVASLLAKYKKTKANIWGKDKYVVKFFINDVKSQGAIVHRDTDDGALDFEAYLSKLDKFAKENPGKPVSPLARALFGKADGIAPATPPATTLEVGPLPTRSELEASRRTFAARREAAREAGGTLKIIDHLRDVWGPWIAAGVLTRADLLHADPSAYSSLTQWLRREGNDLKAALGHDIPTKSEATRSKITPEAIKEARRISSLAARIGRTD